MTKPWEMHENTIKRLYSEHKLADVRKIMSEKYNFTASTRAYRGRLKRWGTHKYNCKRRNKRALSCASSNDMYWTSSDTTSSMMAQYSIPSTYDVTPMYTGTRRVSDNRGVETIDEVSHQCAPTNGSYHRFYNESKEKIILSPPQSDVSYTWNVSMAHPTASSDTFSHSRPPSSSTYFGCTPSTSPLNTHPATAQFTPDHQMSAHRALTYYQPQSRHNSGTDHGEVSYTPMRDYNYDHESGPGPGLLPDNSNDSNSASTSADSNLDIQDIKQSPRSDI
ncbi:hypothetical protein F4775DRAFT_295056 [Biscogniauxia sp. FL1348]|nr:hypothetical protein F4775DRAFT_295056 [Biscogniauxia sp. FL1348]